MRIINARTNPVRENHCDSITPVQRFELEKKLYTKYAYRIMTTDPF